MHISEDEYRAIEARLARIEERLGAAGHDGSEQ
jgi:tetrahydromethanopterin S-methyltransferase subunit G